MVAFFMEFMGTPVVQGTIAAIQYAISVLLVYLFIQWVRFLSPAGRWKLLKIALTMELKFGLSAIPPKRSASAICGV